MAKGVIEASSPDELRCPNCGENPGACSMRGGVWDENAETASGLKGDWVGGTWEMDCCESCGADADGFPAEPNPNMLDAEPMDFDDPYAYREEGRRLHEAQI